MRDKLRECPFCGSKDVSKRLTPGLAWAVGCDNCGCRTREYISSLDAETAWDRRADSKPEESDSFVPDMDFMTMPVPCEDAPF